MSTRWVSFASAVLAGLAAGIVGVACGGSASSHSAASEPAPRRVPVRAPVAAVSARPLVVDVSARRVGSSLHLDITGTARGRHEGESFEDAERWRVEVMQAGQSLQRTVNGPVRVAREPVGKATGDRWDVTVRFSVAFTMKREELPINVLVAAPDERPTRVKITQL